MGRNRRRAGVGVIAEAVTTTDTNTMLDKRMSSLVNELQRKSFDENDGSFDPEEDNSRASSQNIFESFVADINLTYGGNGIWNPDALTQIANTTSAEYGNQFGYPSFEETDAGIAIDAAIKKIRNTLANTSMGRNRRRAG